MVSIMLSNFLALIVFHSPSLNFESNLPLLKRWIWSLLFLGFSNAMLFKNCLMLDWRCASSLLISGLWGVTVGSSSLCLFLFVFLAGFSASMVNWMDWLISNQQHDLSTPYSIFFIINRITSSYSALSHHFLELWQSVLELGLEVEH